MLLFVHDHKFRRVNGKIYTIGGLNDNVLRRYLNLDADLSIYARILDEDSKAEQWSLIKERVTINGDSSLSGAKLEEEVKKSDAVIIRLPSFLGNKACKLALKYNKPYMIEMVGCAWDSLYNHGIKGKIIAPYSLFITRKYVKNAPFVLYVTEKFLQKRYPTKGKTVGVSDVIITPMTDLEKEQRIDKIRNYKKQKPIKIGTTAAVNVSYKGQRFVIEALGMLKKKGITNFEYHLAGSGDQSALKSVAESCNVSDKVIFHGNVKHEELNSFLDSLDVYIQPSLQEGLPRALVEAMSRGLLCIGADTGGIPELLEDKWICQDKKRLSVEIAEKLKYTLNSDKLEDSVIFNINRSNDFREEKLTQKRDSFMQEFISYAKKINRRR